MFKFEPKVTLGEILLITGLIISSYLFFFKSGKWLGAIETRFLDVQKELVDVKHEQWDENYQIGKIKERISKIEGAVNIIRRQTR